MGVAATFGTAGGTYWCGGVVADWWWGGVHGGGGAVYYWGETEVVSFDFSLFRAVRVAVAVFLYLLFLYLGETILLGFQSSGLRNLSFPQLSSLLKFPYGPARLDGKF